MAILNLSIEVVEEDEGIHRTVQLKTALKMPWLIGQKLF